MKKQNMIQKDKQNTSDSTPDPLNQKIREELEELEKEDFYLDEEAREWLIYRKNKNE